MRKLRVAFAAAIAAGIVSAVAAPVSAGPLPCKIFIRNTYVANNPACNIIP